MQPIRKPRVFLSHSKKDVDFIRRLDADLRGTQCETWIDDIELRPGQPWLDQIFGSGIPSCEIVLCYYTENSAKSAVFMQELDARLIERLHNSRVTLLLYVSRAELRPHLRLDLQRLQVPEINEENYSVAFPKLVAEIWRSYAESLVHAATDSERVKRLEAELRVKELESESSTSVFTASESAEFRAIWARIDTKLPMSVAITQKPSSKTGGLGQLDSTDDNPVAQGSETHDLLLKLGTLFRSGVLKQKHQPSVYALQRKVQKDVLAGLDLDGAQFVASFTLPVDIETELLKFGFVQRQYTSAPSGENRLISVMHQPVKLIYTSKFDRFGFWLEYEFGSFQDAPCIELVDAQ